MLRQVRIFLFCVLSVLLVACSEQDTKIDFHDTKGNVVQLSELQGKWVVVNYWAPWCGTCVKEIPELNKFNQMREKDVVLYGVNFDQPPVDALKQAMGKVGITFPVLVEDPNSVWQLSDVSVLPTTFIINPQGKVVKKILGTSTRDSLLAALKEAKGS